MKLLVLDFALKIGISFLKKQQMKQFALDDDDDFLDVPEVTPANDYPAQFLRWTGLIGGFCIFIWAVTIALNRQPERRSNRGV